MQLQILCTLNIAGSSASHRLILTFVAPQMEAPGQFSKLPWRSWVDLGNEERKENKIEKKTCQDGHDKMGKFDGEIVASIAGDGG